MVESEFYSKKEIKEFADSFVLSKKQLEMLEEARNAGPERYTTLDQLNEHINMKYGIEV